jgi:hypothetical protein
MKYKASWAYAHITDGLIMVSPSLLKQVTRLMEEKQAFWWSPSKH